MDKEYCEKMRGGGRCMCDICQSMGKLMEEMKDTDTEELFRLAEEEFEQMKKEMDKY